MFRVALIRLFLPRAGAVVADSIVHGDLTSFCPTKLLLKSQCTYVSTPYSLPLSILPIDLF
jgi:hypothetical protein